MIRELVLLSASVAASVALAQDTKPQIPLLGYLSNGARVRAIAGAPGGVVIGDTIPVPDDITSIAPIPGQRAAIVERSGAQESAVLPLGVVDSGTPAPIANSFPHSDRIAFSPCGSVAVLYSADRHQAQVITGLPDQPQIAQIIDFSALTLPLTSIAVSDDAQAVLAGTSDGASGAVWLFASGQDAQQVASAGNPIAIRFFDGKRDAAFADLAWHQVSILPANGTAQVLAGSGQGIGSPADIEISADQQALWLSDSTSGLFRIDISSGSAASVDGAIPASKLARLSGTSNFLLVSGDGSSAALWAPESANQRMWRILGN